jgi:hypothetical protein
MHVHDGSAADSKPVEKQLKLFAKPLGYFT